MCANSKSFRKELVASIHSKPMGKIVIFRVPEVLLLPQDRCGMLCKCMSGETSGKAKLEQSVTRSAKLQLW